jgi:sec-independent protein translocase protein TatB
MEFLNIGLPEFLLILLLAVVLVGPKDLVKFSRTAGKFLNRLFHSEAWAAFQDTSREIQDLPARMMREAGLDETLRDAKWTGDPASTAAAEAGQSIWPPPTGQPPAAKLAAPGEGASAAGDDSGKSAAS